MKHIGDKGEEFVKSYFIKNGVNVEKNDEITKRLDYDLICKLDNLEFTCEVKYDMMAAKTGNIAMEIWNTKKDSASGITATKADLWVIVLLEHDGMQAFACTVKQLRSFMESAKPFKKIKSGGDNNANLSIYKKPDILKEFTRIDNLTKEEITQWLIQKIT